MQAKATAGIKGKVLRLLLAMALALSGAIGLTHVKAHAEEATLWVSDEYLDFRQYDSNTDNSWRDNIMYIDGEVVITGAEAAEKSYPAFFDDYNMLGGKANVIILE